MFSIRTQYKEVIIIFFLCTNITKTDGLFKVSEGIVHPHSTTTDEIFKAPVGSVRLISSKTDGLLGSPREHPPSQYHSFDVFELLLLPFD